MKKLFIAGNWKSNKTVSEAQAWLSAARDPNGNIVICVPFTLLPALKGGPFVVGAQDVSPFAEGAYTGEVSARQAGEFADWVIVGHSERRKYFSENDDLLQKKVQQAKKAGLKVIYCVPDSETVVPENVDVIAYEPVWAIGTGKTDTPENADRVCAKIKERTNNAMVIYGGSVTDKNVASFVRMPHIDGVLPGGASLDPVTFSRLIDAAQHATK